MFDPYYKWLGIPPEQQPPDHYRLLGLQQFESDLEVIEAAGERQMAHLQNYKIGPQSELSQRILNEIARAKVCLLDPSSKADYDSHLRREIALTRESIPTPHVSPPTPPPVAPLVVPSRVDRTPGTPAGIQTATRPNTRKSSSTVEDTAVFKPRAVLPRRRRRNNFSVAIVVVCLGIIVAAIGGTFVFDLGVRQSGPQATKPVGKELLAIPDVPKGNERRGPSSPPPLKPKRVPPPLAEPGPPSTSGKRPIPTPEQQEAAKRAITIDGNLIPQEFLDAANENQHPWMKYVLYEMAIEQAIKIKDSQPVLATRLALRAVDELSNQFEIDSSMKHRVEDRLRPSPPTRAEIESERVVSAEHDRRDSIVPKSTPPAPAEIEAPVIDLTKAQYKVNIDLQIDGLEPRRLKLEPIAVRNAPFSKRLPSEGWSDHGEPVRLVIRDELPRAGVELSLRGTNPIYIRITPIIEDYDNKLYPWTQDRMKTLRAVLVREIKKCETGIPALRTRIPVLASNVEALKKQPRNIYNRQALELSQVEAEATLANARNSLSALEAKLPILKRQSAGFGQLFELCEQVHLQGRIHFRVLHQVGDQEIVIAQTAR